MAKLKNIALITNIPSPYRVLQFDNLQRISVSEITTIYFRRIEKDRKWNIPRLNHKLIFLKDSWFGRKNIHFDVISILLKLNPDVIIAAGFSATIILTFIYAKMMKKKFIVFTDSWLNSVSKLTFFHRIVRKLIIPEADASICVGKKGFEYLKYYGAKKNSIFISPLAIDNKYYQNFYKPFIYREYDIIFSGQFIDIKMPFFIVEVLKILNSQLGSINFLIIGSGPLEEQIINKLDEINIKYKFPGFIQQEELPKYYANAKILLFPTKDDLWGIVANEACAAGTPVITCDNSGVSGDLVRHNFNGFVLPLSVELWVEHVVILLNNFELYQTFSKNAIEHVQNYSINNAALGIEDAINYCLEK